MSDEGPEDLETAAARPALFARGAPAAARPDTSQAWMVTFTDLVALMLTFFVLLFAMSRIETRDWQNLADALSVSLNSVEAGKVAVPSVELDLEKTQPVPGTNLDYLRSVLEDQMAVHPVLARAALSRQRNWLVISLPADLLFAPGSVQPAETAVEAVYAICGILRSLKNRVEVAGHADPTPPGTGWTSNWRLSLGRALSVAALLQRNCYSGPIVALGHGDSRYADLPAELPAVRRRALARRVDISIHENAWGR